ncbi:bacterial group 2 Ig-like protein [Corallococcus sp. CAG:1435]|nr:bacterial group 2 Ig-like protein [Corallococcus sp. CAG:1435]
MKKLLKIFAVMFIVSVALLAVAAYVPNGDVADAVTADCTHEYSEVVLAQQPSCTQEGWLEHYTCTLCGKYFVKVGEDMVEVDWEDISSPVLVHKWSDWFVKPATCTEEGGEMRYCALCGETEHRGETIDAGHNLTHHEAVESTCEVAGNSEYWSCDRCGLYFSDGQGSQPIEENSWMLPLAKHTYGELIEEVSATCTAVGTKAHYECSVCHKLFVDGESGKVEVSAEELVIPTTGHTYDAVTTGNNVCTVCHEHEITQAEIVEKLYALESGKALDGTYLLTGIVTNVDGTNATIIVEEKDIYLYSFQSTDEFLVGDSVSVVGTLKHFDNYYEFDAGTVTEVTHPEYTLTFGANVEGYTVTLADGSPVPTSATNGTTYEVKITVPKGYKVASVTVNETVVDMSESGTYSVTVCGETTVHVEIVSKMSQQEVALTFPDDNQENNGVGSYTDTWTAIKDGHEWTISNFNNNRWNWTYIKAGRKSDPSVATITTHFAEQITKVVVTVDEVTASKINSFKLIVATDEKFANIVETVVAQEIAAGDMEFVVTAPAANLYYKIEIDCPVAGSNGIIQISKVTYTSVVCEHEWGTWAHKSDATCTESATESRICDLCESEEVRTVGEPLGHTWGAWKSNGNGTHTGTCTREGCDYTVKEDCTFVDGKCEVCGAQEVVTHSVTVGYTVNGNAATTLPEGVTVKILGENGLPVTDLANVVEGTITIKVTAEGFDIVVTCNDTPVTMDGGAGTFDLTADATLSVTLTTQPEHKGTAEDPYSVADALAIASVIGQGNYTEKVYIKGLIVDVGSRGDYLSNIYIADTADGTKMLVFSAKFSETVATIYEGDTVVFHGYITNYNGTLEIAAKGKDYPEMTAVTRGSRPITVQMENATTTLPTSAPIESTVTFTVTANEGYEVVSVKVNGNFITPVEGTYSFVVGETNAVEVTIQKITTKHQVSVNGDVEGYTVTTDNGIKLPGEVSEGALKFTVTAPEGYQVATVSVGGAVLTADADGYYTTEVAGEITINITFSEVVVLPTELLTELTFPDDNQVNNKVSAYDTTWTAIKDGHEWKISNFNNNNWNSWTYIKAGSKNYDSIATIATHFAEQIAKVVVTVDTVTAEKINSFKLIVATDEKFENIVETVVAQEIATGDIEFVVTAPTANLYYKIEVDCASASSNGIIQISKVAYWHVVCDHSVETWTPNNNGTHSGTCSLCGETVTEDCTYQDGKCTVCEAVQPSHSITVEIANGRVTDLNGESLSATALHGTELSFKVAVNEGYVVDKVMVNGEPVDAVDGVYTVIIKGDTSIVVSTRDAATTVTVTWETFTSTSDAKDDISYTTAKGEGTSDPAINDGEIRLYQSSSDGKGGGEITVTAGNGKTITAISIGSSMKTSVKYSYVNAEGVTVEKTVSLSANGKIDLSDVNATSITFTCMGTSKSTRFYVNYLAVTYR